MKSLTKILSAAVLSLGLAGCGEDSTTPNPNPSTPTKSYQQRKTYTGIIPELGGNIMVHVDYRDTRPKRIVSLISKELGGIHLFYDNEGDKKTDYIEVIHASSQNPSELQTQSYKRGEKEFDEYERLEKILFLMIDQGKLR